MLALFNKLLKGDIASNYATLGRKVAADFGRKEECKKINPFILHYQIDQPP